MPHRGCVIDNPAASAAPPRLARRLKPALHGCGGVEGSEGSSVSRDGPRIATASGWKPDLPARGGMRRVRLPMRPPTARPTPASGSPSTTSTASHNVNGMPRAEARRPRGFDGGGGRRRAGSPTYPGIGTAQTARHPFVKRFPEYGNGVGLEARPTQASGRRKRRGGLGHLTAEGDGERQAPPRGCRVLLHVSREWLCRP